MAAAKTGKDKIVGQRKDGLPKTNLCTTAKVDGIFQRIPDATHAPFDDVATDGAAQILWI